MTRVKYPTKTEIQAQVREIIERSEIFDGIAGDECAECQRVNNRSDMLKNTILNVAGIAAFVVLLMVIEPILGGIDGIKNSHAYGPSTGITEEIYDGENNINQNIISENPNSNNISENDSYKQTNAGSEKISDVSIYTNVRGSYKNYKINIERTYQTPDVYKQGNKFTEISSAYAEYAQRIDSYLQDKYYVNASAYDKYAEVSVKADFSVSHNSSYYSGVQNIISFTNKYEEVASSGGTNIEKKLAVYYSNYDVDTGQRLSITDVYPQDMVCRAIAAVINQEINEMVKEGIFSLQSISDNYIGEAKIEESVKNDDNWYISPTGNLVIQCNGFRTAADLDGLEYGRSQSFIIDKSVLKPFDKNSKYVTYE